jgi:hypothetical protein
MTVSDSPDSEWRRPGEPLTRPGAHVPPWLRELVRWMDSAFEVPGTKFRVGLDPILGLLLPGAGDVLSAIPSLLLLTLAGQRGVPPIIVLRMVLNVAIDSLIGAIPFLGDVFDFAYRSNEKNLALLEAHAGKARRPGLADYLVVGFAISVALSLALLPLLLVAWLMKVIFS